MASRQKAEKQKRERIWNFEVTDPTLHPNGFTIYKITCKVFVVTVPDSLTEVVVWKRYNDFKQLYKAMFSLHRSLHRKDEFPPFAKPKLFGRFDETVIEERRTSALQLLNFVGQHSYLYRSRKFLEFFEGGEKTSDASGEILKPSKLDIISTDNTSETDEGQRSKEVLQPTKHPTNVAAILEVPTTERAPSPSGQEQSESDEMVLEGVWKFPQVPDNISLNSYEDTDESSVTDVESALGTPLPDTDLSFFDPLNTEELSGTPELRTSSSWLFAAMDTCAGMDEDVPPSPKNSMSDGGIQIDFLDSIDSSTDDLQTPINDQDTFTSSSSTVDLSDFDPLKPRTESKVEYGKGDLDLSLTRSIDSTVSSGSSSAVPSPRKQIPTTSPRGGRKPRTLTNESVSTMDLGGREDYIYVAANKICQAQEFEASGKFEEAFAHYKVGVGILLQGVQGDKNKSRRDAVRRKTAQYLLKAEDLYNRHLAHETTDERRWATDSMLSPSTELDPSLAFIKAPTSELKNFKVLGTVDKVLLVMDKTTDETYVIKTVHKSSTYNRRLRSILPTSCPHMVSLHKFYETDNAMYLLLQYACGGKLWNYISAYLQYSRGYHRDYINNPDGMAEVHGNIYSGHKMHDSDVANKLPPESMVENSENKFHSETPGIELWNNSGVQFNKENSKTRSPGDEELGNLNIGAKPTVLNMEWNNRSIGADDLKPEDFSFSHEHNAFMSPQQENVSSSKVKYDRFLSVSSEETTDLNENDQSEFNVGSMEQRDIVFHELLENNKTNLRDFSINSVESHEGIERKDSVISDKIESIREEEENSLACIANNQGLGKLEGKKLNEIDSNKSTVDEDAQLIVQSAKELIKSVERTLSQTDIEVQAVLSPVLPENDRVTKVSINSDKDETIIEQKSILNGPNSVCKSSKTSSGVNSCDTLVDDNDSNEVSIYDIHRSHDTNSSSSSNEIDKDNKSVTGNILKPQGQGQSKKSDIVKDDKCDLEMNRKNTLVRDRSSSSENHSDESRKNSRSSTLTEQTSHSKNVIPPAKLNLARMNSNELSRSASFDHELTSPSRTKQRNMSGVFQQLDLAASSSEQVKLPESCIQQWAAEMVVALSVLHAEGIVCRDLKPSNILLGDRGHVLLSYFCQLSNIDKELDFEAVEQLFVAPELKGITGYTDVCDWWSLGAILYELLVGKSLSSCHPGGITPHTQLNIPEHVSPEAQGLLRQLLCYSPRERLGAGMDGAEEVKAHPFFNSINWHSLEN